MRVSVIQFDVVRGDKRANFAIVEERVKELVASPLKPDLVVLPELWSTGYVLERISELATVEGGEEADFLGSLARKNNIWFAGGSVAAKVGGKLRNRAQVIDRTGELKACYDKIHLVPMFDEHIYFDGGQQSLVYEIEDFPFGFIVCYDLRFGELTRKLALDGARALIVSAQWPKVRMHHWQVLLQARAVENQFYVVAANVSSSVKKTFAGHSAIYAPDGSVVESAAFEDGAISADLRVDDVQNIREAVPVFKDRRPDCY